VIVAGPALKVVIADAKGVEKGNKMYTQENSIN